MAMTTLTMSCGGTITPRSRANDLCPVAPPSGNAEVDFVVDLHGLHADVVGVLDRPDQASAIEGDVELARKIVKFAVREDEVCQFADVRRAVDQLLRIDSGGGIRSEIPDIVGAGSAGVKADRLGCAEALRARPWAESAGSANSRAS